jgi:hypothetical protein
LLAAVLLPTTLPCCTTTQSPLYSCGDMYHLDLSVWAYELLAEKKW